MLTHSVPDRTRDYKEKQMGRPINKRYFGTPTATGNQIKVQFHNGSSSVPGWIVKQKASKKFLCEDGQGNTAICRLVQTATDAANLTAGQMTISVKLDNTDVVQVKKIAARVMTATDGVRYPWNFSTSTTDGAAQMEEAGTDGTVTAGADLTLGTDDDVLTGADEFGDPTP